MANDIRLFLSEVVRRPTEIVAVAPSSANLGRKMTEGYENVEGPIVEVGPGTGVFTQAMLDRGVDPERLTLFEMNEAFCDKLREKFPGVTVYNRPAQDMLEIGLKNVGAVISGIPILSRPQIQRDIVGSAFKAMAPGGHFTQFTYASIPPVDAEVIEELDLRFEKRNKAWNNIPPARVYRFFRAAE